MAIENPVFQRLVSAITPVVSIGVGSAVCCACTKCGLNPASLQQKDLPVLKQQLIVHYEQFWANKMDAIRTSLASLN